MENKVRYTLKSKGKYWSGQGSQVGFLAPGISGSYSMTLEQAKELQKQQGGEIVEVKPGQRPFSREEGETIK